jgi:hypothetical protein
MKAIAAGPRPGRSGSLRAVSGLPFAADTLHASFAIVGALFVVWAAVIAGLGLARPRFPGGAGGQRAVVAISIVLAAVVMGFAVTTA